MGYTNISVFTFDAPVIKNLFTVFPILTFVTAATVSSPRTLAWKQKKITKCYMLHNVHCARFFLYIYERVSG
jgi:hypothetical protein